MTEKSDLLITIEQKIKDLNPKEKLKAIALYKLFKAQQKCEQAYQDSQFQIAFDYNEKFNGLRKSLLKELNSSENPQFQKAENISEFFTEEELSSNEFKQAKPEPISNFWLKVFESHNDINLYITNEDKQVLKYLLDINLELPKDSDDYSIEFTFDPNGLLQTNKLKIEVITDEEGNEAEMKSTPIVFKEGADVRYKEVETKKKNKKTKKMRLVKEKVKVDSFFWIFDNYKNKYDYESEEDEGKEGKGKGCIHNCEEDDEQNFQREKYEMTELLCQIFKIELQTDFIPLYFGLQSKRFNQEEQEEQGKHKEEEKKVKKKEQ